MYSYTQNNNDELTLTVGDIIDFIEEVEEGWWRGKLNGKIGVFPSNFVVAFNSVSPILANRRSVTGNVSRIRSSLSSSREELVSSTTGSATTPEKDAPSLPPKPGLSFFFHLARPIVVLIPKHSLVPKQSENFVKSYSRTNQPTMMN